MRFHEAANYLFALRRFPQRPGTDVTAALLDSLGNPHEEVACVQIAGSNGKGSTARMLESILREAGLDVGLYTSPHLDDIRERIRVNGRMLPKEHLVSFVDQVEPYVTERATDGEAPTFFETVTAMALWEFARQDVDVAVLEVGIGGRYDATSVVEPVASAVTSVALEHTDLLGEDVETIAKDKASVEPDDRPLVTAATGDALAAVREQASEVCVVSAPETDGEVTAKEDDGAGTAEQDDGNVVVEYGGRDDLEGSVTITGEDWRVDSNLALLGAHQAKNAGVATMLARQVLSTPDDVTTGTSNSAPEPDGDRVSEGLSAEAIERGLRNAHWPGRFEVMGREPLVVLDGAHNPRGCAAVTATLSEFEYDTLHAVVGVMADKDHRGIARALGDVETVVACEPDTDRSEDNEVLAAVFEDETAADVSTRADVAGALADVLESAGPDDCVLVTGSLYTVAEARTRWSRRRIPKRAETIPEARRVLEDAHVTDAGTWRMRGKAVHRLVKTRVQPRQAQYLKEELLSLGGECAISGVSAQGEENVTVVLMGTMAQFKRLCGKLDGQPYGLSPFADELRETLNIEVEQTTDYPWDKGTAVMGILNVTPDSFHDGGEHDDIEDAIERATEMVEAGVDIVDVGGESTRPGADPVPVEEELARVRPVIERLADEDVLVAVDTRKATVARAALEAGADILNDVSGLEDPEMRLLAAEYDVPVVLMHSINTPVDPNAEIHYDDVVEDVIEELNERVLRAERAGLEREQIIIDPGLGFGKSASESFELLARIEEFEALGCPVLVGHSHKSMFETVDRGPQERYEATIAATALAADRGVDVVRVHDVDGNVAAVDVVEALDCSDTPSW